jgi:hypothetical protein
MALGLFLRLPLLFVCFVQLKYSSVSSLFSGTIFLFAMFPVSPALWELEQESLFYLFMIYLVMLPVAQATLYKVMA